MIRRNHLRLVEPLPDPQPTPPAEPTGPAVDLMAFRCDFEKLLERYGVRLDFGAVPTLTTLPALIALTAVMHGATVDMPRSTYERYNELRADLGMAYPRPRTGGAS